jgi:hypothetical protein
MGQRQPAAIWRIAARGSRVMARLVGKLVIELHGIEACKASFASIAESANNACLDLDVLEWPESGGVTFNGMSIMEMGTSNSEGMISGFRIKPTVGMILFVAWLMANLPRTATVVWRHGWPVVYCPPNDDADFEDDPTPLMPNELELV